MADVHLAIGHHLLVFTLAGLLAAELGFVRAGMSSAAVKVLGRMDLAYGVVAGLIIVVGFMRVFLGAKGSGFYLPNPVFWTKITAFAAVGLISIAPTIQIFKWSKRAKADPAAVPLESEVRRVRRMLIVEAAVFLTIPVWAALMARGVGL